MSPTLYEQKKPTKNESWKRKPLGIDLRNKALTWGVHT
jgi:hypothetical protein